MPGCLKYFRKKRSYATHQPLASYRSNAVGTLPSVLINYPMDSPSDYNGSGYMISQCLAFGSTFYMLGYGFNASNSTYRAGLWYSTDKGVTWGVRPLPNQTGLDIPRAFVFTSSGRVIVILNNSTGNTPMARYSDDFGLTWSALLNANASNYSYFRNMAINGTTLIIVGNANSVDVTKANISYDSGDTWSLLSNLGPSSSSGYEGIAYGNGAWLVVNSFGGLTRSTDNGATWASVGNGAAPFASGVRQVRFLNDKFFVFGSFTTVAYSTTGAAPWSTLTLPSEMTGLSELVYDQGSNSYIGIGACPATKVFAACPANMTGFTAYSYPSDYNAVAMATIGATGGNLVFHTAAGARTYMSP